MNAKINALLERLQLKRLHNDQSGAVALLLLAAFLILFMLAMVLYDTGKSARDKMDVQIAADNGAYSHSIVKARTMNMVAYSNTIKRMIYAYANVYATGWAALLAQFALDASQCFRLIPNPAACVRWGKGLVMIITEGIEAAVTNIPQMIPGGSRAQSEIAALGRYQSYMIGITPWWAYVENIMRANTSGAMLSTAWPPPPGNLTAIADKLTDYAGMADEYLGTSIMDLIPAHTKATDGLPLKRRDADSDALIAAGHTSYCIEYVGSYEQLALSIQYLAQTKNIGTMKLFFTGMSIVPAIGCIVAGLIYGDDVLDYKIAGGAAGLELFRPNTSNRPSDKWLGATGSTTLTYKPRAGRNADSGDRSKLNFLKEDYSGVSASPLYRNEGYFALARSEIVYQDTSIPGNLISNFAAPDSKWAGALKSLTARPNMWSPSWTGRLRPVALPGESFGSSTHGGNAGLNEMFFDMAPFLLVGSLIGLVDDDFSYSSAAQDIFYLHRATQGFNAGNMEGIAK